MTDTTAPVADGGLVERAILQSFLDVADNEHSRLELQRLLHRLEMPIAGILPAGEGCVVCAGRIDAVIRLARSKIEGA